MTMHDFVHNDEPWRAVYMYMMDNVDPAAYQLPPETAPLTTPRSPLPALAPKYTIHPCALLTYCAMWGCPGGNGSLLLLTQARSMIRSHLDRTRHRRPHAAIFEREQAGNGATSGSCRVSLYALPT